MTIILSIKPYYLYLILIGKKTIELRKSFPQRKEWDKTAFLYCTKDMKSFAQIPEKDQGWMRDKLGKIACKIVVDKFYKFIPTENGFRTEGIHSPIALHKSRLRICQIKSYLKARTGYGWNISHLILFKPRALNTFMQSSPSRGRCQRELTDEVSSTSSLFTITSNLITRPPQSWCYAREVLHGA